MSTASTVTTASTVAPSVPIQDEPLVRVVHGWPGDEELAALVVALLLQRAALAQAAAERNRRSSLWATPARVIARPVSPGGWRGSASPW